MFVWLFIYINKYTFTYTHMSTTIGSLIIKKKKYIQHMQGFLWEQNKERKTNTKKVKFIYCKNETITTTPISCQTKTKKCHRFSLQNLKQLLYALRIYFYGMCIRLCAPTNIHAISLWKLQKFVSVIECENENENEHEHVYEYCVQLYCKNINKT